MNLKGKKIRAYRDENDNIHLVNNSCTHLGCSLKWNDGERTWDCPCHGSRFSYRGEVLEGPAVNPLELAENK
ncbi:Rieske 2Fe-2S domain-containing protein [Carnobacterium funditum]|uniref:Rieske 2Fe-2S domain-containing protein n=1 Tax=Carnobacterium funditum TaxID=2752 RepID=UPI000B172821